MSVTVHYYQNISNDSNKIRHTSSVSQNTIFDTSGCSDVVVEYRTRNREVAGSTYTRSSASNLEQVANLLCAQANSASYP